MILSPRVQQINVTRTHYKAQAKRLPREISFSAVLPEHLSIDFQ